MSGAFRRGARPGLWQLRHLWEALEFVPVPVLGGLYSCGGR